MSRVPPAYVAGSIAIQPGRAFNLLDLIRQQLEPECPGTATEVQLSSGSGTIFVGAFSRVAGPLTASNWAYELTPGDRRNYRSSYPGANSPLGDLQVFTEAASVLHVEVQS